MCVCVRLLCPSMFSILFAYPFSLSALSEVILCCLLAHMKILGLPDTLVFLSGETLYVTRLRSLCDRCRVDWYMFFHFFGRAIVCNTFAVLVRSLPRSLAYALSFLSGGTLYATSLRS